MKKKMFIILGIISICLIGNNVFALNIEEIHSNEALLINMSNDEVLFSKNTNNNAVPIASLTKLMTYAVVIDEISDLQNTKVKVPTGLVQEMINKSASRAGLIDDYEYSALDLLYGVMLPSGCDAAEVLARYIGGGDSSVFVAKMNNKAASLGMTNTYYVDSYGIGTQYEENISTEQDLYKLVKYVYNLPYFKQIISTEYYNITGQNGELQDVELIRNTNYLMGEYSGGAYYNPYSIGGKTGNLDVAGKCLVTIAKKGEIEVVAITLGVPGEAGSNYDYNLTDHNILLDYAFSEHTENITIDLGPEYRSLEIGKQHKIEATTSDNTPITWISSDPSIATVDEFGIVTGVSQGQVKITASTITGNLDYTYVSVNFYNGVHTKYSSGSEIAPKTYAPIDYSILKKKGYDYVLIRAGYGDSGIDKTFAQNLQNALKNKMNVGIWFEGYAENIQEATNEANNLVSILNNLNIENLKEKLSFPILYSLINDSGKDPKGLEAVIKTFNNILKTNDYSIMVEVNNKTLSKMDTNSLKNEGIDLGVVYRQILPDLETTMNVNNTDVCIWNYKVNSYLGSEFGPNNSISLMYMNYNKLTTIHKEYKKDKNKDNNSDNQENEKNDINHTEKEKNKVKKIKTTYVTKHYQKGNNSHDNKKNEIKDNTKNKEKTKVKEESKNKEKKEKQKNTKKTTDSSQEKSDDKEIDTKKESGTNFVFVSVFLIVAALGIILLIIFSKDE